MIGLEGVGKYFGGRTLFEGVSCTLNAGARYGLVGANGSGKTTLLRILAGDEPASEGAVTIPKRARLGVLRQDQFSHDDERVIDVAMRGDIVVWQAMQRREAVLAAAPDPEELLALDDVIAQNEGYTLRARASGILEGLGIPVPQHELPLRALSGGYKLRALLAQVLAGRPDALFLDEPTNHLDILSIRWLEKFLQGYDGCAVIISHDQRFLENVATHVLDVDYGTVTLYSLGLTGFLAEKELRRTQKEAELEGKLEQIEHKRAFIERFGAKNTKARQAQSRQKQIDKLQEDLDELPTSSRRAPLLRFEVQRPSGKDVLELQGIAKSYGDKPVLAGVSLRIQRGERVAIVGPNGVGKSTLLKIAQGVLAPDAGSVRWGHETQVGYFAQDHRDLLVRPEDTPFTFLQRASPDTATAFVRGHLGRVLFSGDDVHKSVHALSGGEAARLVLAQLIVTRPNVLLLDEPTNHLDLEAIQALVEALRAFEGTLVFVSHDRWFVDALAARVIELGSDSMRDFRGTWAEYLASCGDDHLDADAISLKARRQREETSGGASAWEEQKRRRNLKSSLEKKRDKLLLELEGKERRRAEIRDQWCAEGFYESHDAAAQRALTEEEAALGAAIDTLVAAWEKLEEELASFA